MSNPIISGTGLFTPPYSISNEELVASFNAFVNKYNQAKQAEIEAGYVEALLESSTSFIEKASGIKNRYVMEKSGILDPDRMFPHIPDRTNDQPSLLCDMAVAAAQMAMVNAKKNADQIDAVIFACSNMQRAYPAMAIEVQQQLGIDGFAYDMNVACSSATFGLQNACDAISSGSARTVLMVNVEVCSSHLNFRNRDSHFIFGDAATAVIIEKQETLMADEGWEILGTKLCTQFSSNIRNNFGFLNRCAPEGIGKPDKLFSQEGRKVFKEVCPMVVELIENHLSQLDLKPHDLKRFWLHQANLSMNQLIMKKLMGFDVDETMAPIILDDYANTSSAGSIIAFHNFHEDLKSGDLGLICSFGAGYSIGNVVVRRL